MVIYFTQKMVRDNHNQACDSLEQNYLDYFLMHPLTPKNTVFIPVPNHLKHAKTLFDTIPPRLIIFTGGNNLNPKDLGQSLEIDDLAPARDEVERFLYQKAINQKIPLMGICRGFQHINVLSGGRVSFHLENHPPAQPHDVVYEAKTYRVNSYHNHGVMTYDVAHTLKPIVLPPNQQIVEAYISQTEPTILGLQWHPERPHTSETLFTLLYETFLKQAHMI